MPLGRCVRLRRGLDGGAEGGVGELARLPRIMLRLRSCSSAASAALARRSGICVVNVLRDKDEMEGGKMDVAFVNGWCGCRASPSVGACAVTLSGL
jgi:hypothetical protein